MSNIARFSTGRMHPLVAPVLLGAALRLVGLDRLSYWLDETTSVTISSQSPDYIWNFLGDTHPPFYHFLLHLWLTIGGVSEGWTRLLSGIFGVLTIPVIYFLGNAVLDKRTGLWAAWLLALSPVAVWYSQETRMYAMLYLLVALSALLAVLWAGRPSVWLAGAYVVVTLAGLYTEYLMLVAWALIAAFVPLYYRSQLSRRAIVTWTVAQAIIVLGCVPLLRFLQAHLPVVLSADFFRPHIGQLAAYLPLLAPVGLLGVAALVLWWRLRRKYPAAIDRATAIFFVVALAASIAGALVPSGNLFKRTLLVFAPVLFVGAAWGIMYLRSRLVSITSLCVASAAALVVMYFAVPKEEWRQAVTQIDREARSGDVALIEPEWMRRPFGFYDRASIETVPVAPADLDEPLSTRLGTYQRVWLVLSSEKQIDPQQEVERWFRRRYTLVESLSYYHIRVLLFSTRQP